MIMAMAAVVAVIDDRRTDSMIDWCEMMEPSQDSIMNVIVVALLYVDLILGRYNGFLLYKIK